MNKIILLAAAGLTAMGLSSASAADLAVKAPYGAPSPVWNWTGFYAGVHAGAGWGTTESTLTSISGLGVPVTPVNLPIAQNNRSGFLGGGQIGYNYQSGWAVFGVQADIAGLDVKGTTPCITVLSCTAKSDWLATATGRIGGVVADKTLVYAKGGAAWLNTTHSVTLPAVGIGGIGGLGVGGTASTGTTSFGWLIGAGAEYAFSPNWSAFLEYDYMEFDSKNAALDLSALGGLGAGAATGNVAFKNKLSIAKIGINYKFGGPAPSMY
jgi:outer membrane immunogenic protein